MNEKTGNYTYINKNGEEVTVIDPYRMMAMEMLDIHGMTLDDLGKENFEPLVEHLRADLKESAAPSP